MLLCARTLIPLIFIALALLSVVLNAWQWYAGRRFRFGAFPSGGFSPPLSILRPLKGCDSKTHSCLESWFRQEYNGGFELLFGVASAEDPVCGVVRELMQKYPRQSAQLLICDPILGTNAKVSSLCYLLKRAQHEHIIISDQDVFVSDGFLSTLIQPLLKETVGLVNCFYILADPRGLAMRLEAVAVNADFWSQVLQSNMLKPMDFALGAVMAATRKRLAQIGGFEALLDYLADDYQLGNRIARAGGELKICSMPVECRSEPQRTLAVWKHQVRWARTIRVCQPMPYFLSVLSNPTLWPVIAAIVFPLWGVPITVGSVILRIFTAKSNYERLTQASGWLAGLLAPAKDLAQIAIWMAAFAGNDVVWRAQRFRVDRGGKLTPKA